MILKKCDCKGDKNGNKQAAEYQDQKNGQGMRWCNESMDRKDATCTVCGKEHKA